VEFLTGQLAGAGRATGTDGSAIDTQYRDAYVLVRSGKVHVDLHRATSQPHAMRMGDRREHYRFEIATDTLSLMDSQRPPAGRRDRVEGFW
jgi:hypothetical protein